MKLSRRDGLLNRYRLMQIRRILKKVNLLTDDMATLTDEELQAKTVEFKDRLQEGETLDDLLPEAFAVVREADKRILGMFPYDVQVIGGIVLHQGRIAEMRTGEGKTLTATMPLYLNALTGKGAILVTVNPYLAERDAKEMGQVYEWLGLTVGIGVSDEDQESDFETRKSVYDADITYTTSTTLGFDYLSNNLVGAKSEKFMRDFNYVIVDEADAVLLDSAQTPLIISGSPRVQSNYYGIANQFVTLLKPDEEYYFNEDKQQLYLTTEGARYAERFFNIPDLYDNTYFELNRHINLALRAHFLYKLNRDYVVVDGEVKLLDNKTGRIMDGTKLQSGMHQAIEMKEGVRVTPETRAMASVTYQNLFNMFPKLAGMTGTGKTAESELGNTYRLEVVVIPTYKPLIRIDHPEQIYTTLPEKLEATLAEVHVLHNQGRPILLISGSVEIAEVYSNMLLREGITHNLLTARNTVKEAQIIKEAGQLGAVTIATTLAGRGTDIKLGPGVKELGGLAVLGTERMANARFDWQLRGRAGRQGDPGMSKFFVSLEDELLIRYASARTRKYFEKHNHSEHRKYGLPLTKRRYARETERAQRRSEDGAERARKDTVSYDMSMTSQRYHIYRQRDELMKETTDVSMQIEAIARECIANYAKEFHGKTETEFQTFVRANFTYKLKDFPPKFEMTEQYIKHYLFDLYENEMTVKRNKIANNDKVSEFYRISILKAIDGAWVEEVDYLQQLRNLTGIMGTAQRNVQYEYHKIAQESYEKMSLDVKKQVLKNLMLSSIKIDHEENHSVYYV